MAKKQTQIMYGVTYIPLDNTNEYAVNYCKNKEWLTFQNMEIGCIHTIYSKDNEFKVKVMTCVPIKETNVQV